MGVVGILTDFSAHLIARKSDFSRQLSQQVPGMMLNLLEKNDFFETSGQGSNPSMHV
jgi:hypothetical protein